MGRAGGLGLRNPSQMLAKAQQISGKFTLQITISRFSEQKTSFQVKREAKRANTSSNDSRYASPQAPLHARQNAIECAGPQIC